MTSKVAVLTDSAASLPDTAVVELGVRLVPMNLVVGGTQYADGTVRPEDLVRRARTEGVSTSAPSPGDFLKVVETARDDGFDHAVVLTVSRRMSGSYQSAVTAAGYLEGAATVIDSGTAAGAQGLVVLAAARAAATGASAEEVIATARRVAATVQLTAALEHLEHLAASGRVRDALARVGDAVGMVPMFSFLEGHVRVRRPALSIGAATDRIIAGFARTRPETPARLHAAVLHAAAVERAERLIEALAEQAGDDRDVYVAPFSSVMVAHTGPGLFGLAWWWEPAVG